MGEYHYLCKPTQRATLANSDVRFRNIKFLTVVGHKKLFGGIENKQKGSLMKILVRSLISVVFGGMVVLTAQNMNMDHQGMNMDHQQGMNMNHQEKAAVAGDQAGTMTLTQVEAKYVCMGMGADRLFDRELMPAVVDGKTYYGCCGGCQAKLMEDPQMRVAVDPISGAKVDKATAVIGALPSGEVHYFESMENFQKFEKIVSSIKVTKTEGK
jgi:YHS domain-containing protein